MATKRPFSPRADFSPLIVSIDNQSLRPIKVRLFDPRFFSKLVKIKMEHPQMPYITSCSMMETLQLTVNRTQMQVVKGSDDQLGKVLILMGDQGFAEQLTIPFVTPRRAEIHIASNPQNYKIGARQRLPTIDVLPKTKIELSFFIPDGTVPAEKKSINVKSTSRQAS